MSAKRTILVEAALVIAVLTTGITAAGIVHAAPISAAVQGATDPRANVKIESDVKVERTEKDASGNDQVTLHTPSDVKVIPGDKLLFVNAYRNTGATPVTGFVVSNPIHPAVTFTEVSENWAVVSVDGGKSFGKLTDLTVAITPDATADKTDAATTEPVALTRAAQPSDVTHIRWVFADAIPGGASGKLQFRGVVK